MASRKTEPAPLEIETKSMQDPAPGEVFGSVDEDPALKGPVARMTPAMIESRAAAQAEAERAQAAERARAEAEQKRETEEHERELQRAQETSDNPNLGEILRRQEVLQRFRADLLETHGEDFAKDLPFEDPERPGAKERMGEVIAQRKAARAEAEETLRKFRPDLAEDLGTRSG